MTAASRVGTCDAERQSWTSAPCRRCMFKGGRVVGQILGGAAREDRGAGKSGARL